MNRLPLLTLLLLLPVLGNAQQHPLFPYENLAWEEIIHPGPDNRIEPPASIHDFTQRMDEDTLMVGWRGSRKFYQEYRVAPEIARTKVSESTKVVFEDGTEVTVELLMVRFPDPDPTRKFGEPILFHPQTGVRVTDTMMEQFFKINRKQLDNFSIPAEGDQPLFGVVFGTTARNPWWRGADIFDPETGQMLTAQLGFDKHARYFLKAASIEDLAHRPMTIVVDLSHGKKQVANLPLKEGAEVQLDDVRLAYYKAFPAGENFKIGNTKIDGDSYHIEWPIKPPKEKVGIQRGPKFELACAITPWALGEQCTLRAIRTNGEKDFFFYDAPRGMTLVNAIGPIEEIAYVQLTYLPQMSRALFELDVPLPLEE